MNFGYLWGTMAVISTPDETVRQWIRLQSERLIRRVESGDGVASLVWAWP